MIHQIHANPDPNARRPAHERCVPTWVHDTDWREKGE